MSYKYPPRIRQLIDQNMAIGKYASEDELLSAALLALKGPLRKPTKYRLEDLLKNCKSTQLHEELEWGEDVGREVID